MTKRKARCDLIRAPDWTAAEDATLARLVGEGVSAAVAGVEMGRSRASVLGRALRRGLRFNGKQPLARTNAGLERFTVGEDEKILALAAEGKSGSQIAIALDRSKSSIVKRAKRIGAALSGKSGPTLIGPPKVKVVKVKLHPANIAGKKEGRNHDPEFKHVTPTVPMVVPRMVKLVDLEADDCRFPIGDPKDEAFGFCGHPKDGGVYCRAHARLCYKAPEMRRKAA